MTSHSPFSTHKNPPEQDVKLLPNILEAVQKYARFAEGDEDSHDYVETLSVVYEVLRRWDKVSPLYKSLGRPTM